MASSRVAAARLGSRRLLRGARLSLRPALAACGAPAGTVQRRRGRRALRNCASPTGGWRASPGSICPIRARRSCDRGGRARLACTSPGRAATADLRSLGRQAPTAGAACSPISRPEPPATRRVDRARPAASGLRAGEAGIRDARLRRRAACRSKHAARERRPWPVGRSRLWRRSRPSTSTTFAPARRPIRHRRGTSCAGSATGARAFISISAAAAASHRRRREKRRRRSQRAGRSLTALAGQTIRVRGALDNRFGLRIEIAEPAMIERLARARRAGESKPRRMSDGHRRRRRAKRRPSPASLRLVLALAA